MDLDRKNSGLGENGKVARKRKRTQLADDESEESVIPSKRRRLLSDELYSDTLPKQDRGEENSSASLPLPRPRPLPFPLLLFLSLFLPTPTSSTPTPSTSTPSTSTSTPTSSTSLLAPSTTRTRSNSKAETSQGVRVKPAVRTISGEDEEEDDIDEVNVRSSSASPLSERRPSSSQTPVESTCNDTEELDTSRSGEQPSPRMSDTSGPVSPARTPPFMSIASSDSSESSASTNSSASSSTSSLTSVEDEKENRLIHYDLKRHIEKDIPSTLLGLKESNEAKYKNGDFEIDMVLDHDEETDGYLVIWTGWSLSTMNYVKSADLKAPKLLKIYGEYMSAADAVENRLALENVSHYRRTDWSILAHYGGRHVLFRNKLREARFNVLLQKVGIAPVFIENWLPTLYKTDVLGELPYFRFIYKSFMADHFSRKFLALPPGFRTSRCKCKCAEDCSASNLYCCISNVSTDSTSVRLSYDAAKRLALPDKIRGATYELVECSDSCRCSSRCFNRSTQRGRQIAAVIFFDCITNDWMLRAGGPIKRGEYITEYVGEIKLASSIRKNANKTHHVQIPAFFDFNGKKDNLVIDASEFGNEARFIRHSHTPNALLVWVYSDDYGAHYSRCCFFAIQNIHSGEEITFDYCPVMTLKEISGIKRRCSATCSNYTPRSDAAVE